MISMFSFFYVFTAVKVEKTRERQNKEGKMEEEFKVIDNYLMVRMPAEVDHHASEYIGRTADRYILKEGVGNVVFDFEKTRFMDSSGIGLILGRYKKAQIWHGEVVLQNLSEPLEKVVRLSGVGGLCRIEHTAGDEGRDENE